MPRTVINLDALIPDDEKVILYKGVEHPLHIATTESYLKVLRARKKLSTIRQDDEAAQTEQSIELLAQVIPTLPREELLRMPLVALLRLVEVVQSEMDREPEQPELVTPNGEVVIEGELTWPSSSPG